MLKKPALSSRPTAVALAAISLIAFAHSSHSSESSEPIPPEEFSRQAKYQPTQYENWPPVGYRLKTDPGDLELAKTYAKECKAEKQRHIETPEFQKLYKETFREKIEEDFEYVDPKGVRRVIRRVKQMPYRLISVMRKVCCFKKYGIPVHPFLDPSRGGHPTGKHEADLRAQGIEGYGKAEKAVFADYAEHLHDFGLTMTDEHRKALRKGLDDWNTDIYYWGYHNFHPAPGLDAIRPLVSACSGEEI